MLIMMLSARGNGRLGLSIDALDSRKASCLFVARAWCDMSQGRKHCFPNSKLLSVSTTSSELLHGSPAEVRTP